MKLSVIVSAVLLLLLAGCSSSVTKAPYVSRVESPQVKQQSRKSESRKHVQRPKYSKVESRQPVRPPKSGKIEPGQPVQQPKPIKAEPDRPVQQQAKSQGLAVVKPEQRPSQQAVVARQQEQAEAITESVMAKMEEKSALHSFLPDAKLRWMWPVKGRVIKSYRSSDPGRRGILINGSEGEKIAAAEAGEVVYSDDGLAGYGQLIIIKHNKSYLSIYAYNHKRLVEKGEWVSRGKPVATMGRASDRAALHFEIRRDGEPQNPLEYLP
ncbi:MAG: peptidoglycan DD-metalloendopeptidase family protein [Pseudomonadota bacterium]